MALSTQQLQAMARARARVAKSALVIKRTYFEEEWEFTFLTVPTPSALEVISRVQESIDSLTMMQQLDACLEFMDLMATTETAALIADLTREGVVTVHDLVNLQQEVVGHMSGRPFENAPSSDTGSAANGHTSMASAPLGESTQLASPMNDS
jgi:hypothetical protein